MLDCPVSFAAQFAACLVQVQTFVAVVQIVAAVAKAVATMVGTFVAWGVATVAASAVGTAVPVVDTFVVLAIGPVVVSVPDTVVVSVVGTVVVPVLGTVGLLEVPLDLVVCKVLWGLSHIDLIFSSFCTTWCGVLHLSPRTFRSFCTAVNSTL